MTRDELQKVRNWADDKIGTGGEPSWLWYQHLKLRECLDAIIAGMECNAVEFIESDNRPAVLNNVVQSDAFCADWHKPNGRPTYDPQTGLRLVVSKPAQGAAQSQAQKAADGNSELEDHTARLLRSAY